jgi:hypothetical protein
VTAAGRGGQSAQPKTARTGSAYPAETAASRGSASLLRSPGVRLATGLNGARIFSGASGLRSNVSS